MLSRNQIAIGVLQDRKKALEAEMAGIDGTIASLGNGATAVKAAPKRKGKRDMTAAHAALAAKRAAKVAAAAETEAPTGASIAEAAS